MTRPASWRITNRYSKRKESAETLSNRLNERAIHVHARPRDKKLQGVHTHSEAKSWSYLEYTGIVTILADRRFPRRLSSN